MSLNLRKKLEKATVKSPEETLEDLMSKLNTVIISIINHLTKNPSLFMESTNENYIAKLRIMALKFLDKLNKRGIEKEGSE
jgi:hypothetical protein